MLFLAVVAAAAVWSCSLALWPLVCQLRSQMWELRHGRNTYLSPNGYKLHFVTSYRLKFAFENNQMILSDIVDHLSYSYWRPSLSIRFLALVLPNINRSGYNFAHTYFIRNILVGRLRPRWACGRLKTKPKRLFFFVILVTHPKSYIETTVAAIWAANRHSWGQDGCPWMVPKKWSRDHHEVENFHINTRRKIHWFQKRYSFRPTTIHIKVIEEKPFLSSGHQALVDTSVLMWKYALMYSSLHSLELRPLSCDWLVVSVSRLKNKTVKHLKKTQYSTFLLTLWSHWCITCIVV